MKKSLIVLGLCAAATVFAQGPPPGRGPGRMGPGGPGGMGMGAGFGAGRTVTGAPFSGQEVTEETQTLSNGNVISRKSQVNIFRDSSGRTRTERTLTQGRPGQAQATAQTASRTVVSIHDPVAGTTSELDTTARTAHTMNLPGRGNGAGPRPNAAIAGGNRPGRGNGPANDPNVTTENLGMQTINGVQATGTRVTRTIPAGRIGNAQPIQMVTETWHSPDLQRPVMVKTTDPRRGTIVTQLTNITRSEPDPSLFHVPSDFTVTKVRGPRGGGNAPVINNN
jgi:hypothetical protein